MNLTSEPLQKNPITPAEAPSPTRRRYRYSTATLFVAAGDVVDNDLAVVAVPLEATLAAPANLADVLVVMPNLVPAELAVVRPADEDAAAELGKVCRARARLLQAGTCVS